MLRLLCPLTLILSNIPDAGAIQKQAHAQRFGTFHSHQSRLTPDVIGIVEAGDLRLVLVGILLQACNPLFDGTAEAGTDLVVILHGAVDWQENLQRQGPGAKNLRLALKFFLTPPIVAKTQNARQITN